MHYGNRCLLAGWCRLVDALMRYLDGNRSAFDEGIAKIPFARDAAGGDLPCPGRFLRHRHGARGIHRPQKAGEDRHANQKKPALEGKLPALQPRLVRARRWSMPWPGWKGPSPTCTIRFLPSSGLSLPAGRPGLHRRLALPARRCRCPCHRLHRWRQIDRIVIEIRAADATCRMASPSAPTGSRLASRPRATSCSQGDGGDPEGVFTIDRRTESAFHLSIGLDYPQPEDRERAAKIGYSPVRTSSSTASRNALPDGLQIKVTDGRRHRREQCRDSKSGR